MRAALTPANGGEQPLIDVQALSFRFSGHKNAVLNDITLTIREGEFVLLEGPSGCGKSSLALALAGLIFARGAAKGSVLVAGFDPMKDSVHEICTVLGSVFQDPETQICTLTVEDEVEFGIGNLSIPEEELEGRITEALTLVGIEHLRNRSVHQLSGGEKQKLALASILAMRPRILVLDEPTSNLDPVSTAEVLDAVRTLHSTGMTTILIEHKVDEIIGDVDRLVLMEHGRIIADGTPAAVYEAGGLPLVDRIGVWVPQVTELAMRLRDNGFPLPTLPTSFTEAQRALENVAFRPRLEPPVQSRAEALLEVRALSFRYPDIEQQALYDVSLTVDRGDFVVLLGPNGAGKSTLARHVVAIAQPPPGAVVIDGRDVGTMSVFEVTDRIGYVFQYPEHQFVSATVADEVAYSLRAREVPPDAVALRVAEAVAVMGLEGLEDRHPFQLSMGQKRRLSVATMLVLDQELLILDEPTFGLDYLACENLMGYLDRLNRAGKTIFMITHDVRLACEWARTAVLMEAGRITYAGPIRELFSSTELLKHTAIHPPAITDLAAALAGAGSRIDSQTINVREFLDAVNA